MLDFKSSSSSLFNSVCMAPSSRLATHHRTGIHAEAPPLDKLSIVCLLVQMLRIHSGKNLQIYVLLLFITAKRPSVSNQSNSSIVCSTQHRSEGAIEERKVDLGKLEQIKIMNQRDFL